jgi:hypothetical protein
MSGTMISLFDVDCLFWPPCINGVSAGGVWFFPGQINLLQGLAFGCLGAWLRRGLYLIYEEQ